MSFAGSLYRSNLRPFSRADISIILLRKQVQVENLADQLAAARHEAGQQEAVAAELRQQLADARQADARQQEVAIERATQLAAAQQACAERNQEAAALRSFATRCCCAVLCFEVALFVRVVPLGTLHEPAGVAKGVPKYLFVQQGPARSRVQREAGDRGLSCRGVKEAGSSGRSAD